MPESLKTKLWRWAFNFFPAYRGTGGRLTYISDDYAEIHVRLPLSWRTRNYVGTIFGGSLYGAVDPVYMIMLIKLLGRDYVVWDKAATIRFRRPGRTTLRARFVVTPEEVAKIKSELAGRKSVDRVYTVELVDDAGKVHAQVEKTLYIARREQAEARRAVVSGTGEEVAASQTS
jgi:acyl-coenzyme A thioesterase PaaI-like protein